MICGKYDIIRSEKTMPKNEFLKLIENQRSEKSEERFSGTFLEYLEILKDNPDIVKTSHKRLYDSIMERGVNVMPENDPRKMSIFGGDNVKVYSYFKDHFFGMENVISKIMRFLSSAAKKERSLDKYCY